MPRDTLSRERIIQAAIELLDAEGMEGLNMRTLGMRLNSAATAIYWHVANKNNLVVLASNEVWNEVGLPDLEKVDWRTAATEMAGDLYRMVSQHPWLVTAFACQPVYGDNKARHDDHVLAVYEKAGFVGMEVDHAATAVFTLVLGHALGVSTSASLDRQLSHGSSNSQAQVRQSLAQAEEIAMRFPRLRARLEAATTESGTLARPEESFEFGLRAVLDGLEDRLRSRPSPQPDSAGAETLKGLHS